MIKLTPRERKISYVVIGLLAFWVLYAFAISPLLDARSQLENNRLTTMQSLQEATHLFAVERVDRRKWDQMTHYGLRTDASAAESQMLHAIQDWARDAGLTLTGNKPDRAEAQKPFQKITFHVTTTGNLAAVNRFLWNAETATIPARIEDLTIAARKEGSDDLSLSVAISTLCIVTPTTAPTGGVMQ
ncbi:MAG TPA: GspMb/PilO family protein [Tepidisphaeraceae bacterium]|nr:GspMb/PilO family protein [Tepidisphaeraceae bacterium]